VKAVAIPPRENTLEGGSPGELRAHAGLTHRSEVADSRVEQGPEVEGRSRGLSIVEVSHWRGVSAHATKVGFREGSGALATARGHGRRRRRAGCAGGGKLWRANPKSGSGMK